MKNKNLSFLMTAIIAVFLFSNLAMATVHRVNNNPGCHSYSGPIVFAKLDSAVLDTAVHPGDTLYVEASATTYGIIILNKRVTIIGAGYFLDVNTGLQKSANPSLVDNIRFDANSSGSTIEGMKIADNNQPYVVFSNVTLSNITVTRCYIQNGIAFQNAWTTAFSNIVITKNYMGGISQSNLPGPISGLMITNNYFGGPLILTPTQSGTIAQNVFQNGVNISGNDFFNNIFLGGAFLGTNTANVHHNLFSIAQPAGITGPFNIFNVSPPAIFPIVGTPDVKLHPLGSCAECLMGAPNQTAEMGIYGGIDPYVKSGIPPIPAIYNLIAPANSYPGSNANTDISTRSNN